MPDEPDPPRPSRRRIAGRYALGPMIGEGAQGRTYEAVDEKTGSIVAVKEFRIRGADSWKSVELAEREASVLASLSHPGLPAHRDHFEEDGALYLVVDRIEGESVESLMARRRLDDEDVARFLENAGEILDYLHSRTPPVIHRDIKPANVLRRPDGSFAIVDFGAVRARLASEGGSTVVGTFGFMAPEQFQGRALPQSDVYAVGATALTMMTGVPPEDLPHRGLAIDVAAALGEPASSPRVAALSRMLNPDPDTRARRVLPLADRRAGAQGSRARSGRSRRHSPPRRHRPSHPLAWFPPVLLVLEVGLTVARLAVALALLVIVPVVLTLLSVVFSGNLRGAAETVRRAGRRANAVLGRTQRSLLRVGREPPGSRSWPPPAREGPRRPTGSADRPRVRVDSSIAHDDGDVAEGSVEQETAGNPTGRARSTR